MKNDKIALYVSMGFFLGVVLGIVVGLVQNDLAMGISIGVGTGMIFACATWFYKNKLNKK